jgi:hypothetical protein
MSSAQRGEILNEKNSKDIDSVQEGRREVMGPFPPFYCSFTSVYILLLKS